MAYQLFMLLWTDDNPIDGLNHVAEVVLFNILLSKRLCFEGDKTRIKYSSKCI
jgi:hypothetical protein